MIVAFLLIATALGTLVYLVLVHGSVPGSLDERLGELEPLPPNLGQWVPDDGSEALRGATREGFRREVRYLHVPASGLLSKEYLVRQVRYRNLATAEIGHVEPEQKTARRRRKPAER